MQISLSSLVPFKANYDCSNDKRSYNSYPNLAPLKTDTVSISAKKNKSEGIELKTSKLSDRKDFEEIYELDTNEFSDLVYYQSSDEFWDYLSYKNIDTYIVKDKDEKLLGYYQIYMPTKDNLYIETLNLKPEYRGKHTGFTSHVFNEIIDIAKKNKAKKISLHVSEKNNIARNLYERLGFKIKCKDENFYDSTENSAAYYMEKQL